MTERKLGARTIGFFIDWTEDLYQQTVLRGVVDFARENGLNCICFEGGSLDSNREYEKQRNIIYRLVDHKTIDGLVMLCASISRFISSDEMKSFCNSFAGVPLVSIAMEIEGIPSVLIDNSSGMRELVSHLVEAHGYGKFAFIKGTRGNQDSDIRYDVFEKTLASFGLSPEPRLIFQGDFTSEAGKAAVEAFLESGCDFDVIVAADDVMAMAAIEELKSRGIRVPLEKAVTGFDNIEICNYASPPITTVSQSIYELGKLGAKRLLDIIEGKAAERISYAPTAKVIRESCGCANKHAEISGGYSLSGISSPKGDSAEEYKDALRTIESDLLNTFGTRAICLPRGTIEAAGEALINGARCGKMERFYKTFDEMMARVCVNGADISAIQLILSEFRHRLLPCMQNHAERNLAEDACFQSLASAGNFAGRREWYEAKELLAESHTLNLLREELLMTLDMSKQINVIRRRLPELGFNTCYIGLYLGDGARENSKSICMLGFHDGKAISQEFDGYAFFSKKLVPDDFFVNGSRFALMVEGLKHIGFLILDIGERSGRVFALVGDIISSGLQSALLFRELQGQRNGLSHNLENMRKAMGGFIRTMAATVETRDPYTAGHQRRVSDLARTIAAEMDLPQSQIEGVRMAGIIHDLGKIYIPSEILNRPGTLDEIELAMIRKHPKVAYDILKNIDFPWPVAEIVYQHHERMNGSGYPNGLKGDEIRIEARILSVADVVEAMASHRPYREAVGLEKALEEILQQKGILYDPDVCDACIRLFKEMGYKFKK